MICSLFLCWRGNCDISWHHCTEIFMTLTSKSRQRHTKHVCCWLHSWDFKFITRHETAPPCAFALLFMMWISWRHGLFLTGWPSAFFFYYPRWQQYNTLPMKNGINHPDFNSSSCLLAIEILQIELMFRVGCFSLGSEPSCSWSYRKMTQCLTLDMADTVSQGIEGRLQLVTSPGLLDTGSSSPSVVIT